MSAPEEKKELLRNFGFEDAVDLLTTIEQIDFADITANFKPPFKSALSLPRIAFFGLFKTMSMTDQRYICRSLGFEFFEKIAFGSLNEAQTDTLSGQWRCIVGGFTQLIVIGDTLPPPRFKFKADLYKTLSGQSLPEFLRYKIPILFESDFVKIHPNYPDLNVATVWKDVPLVNLYKAVS